LHFYCVSVKCLVIVSAVCQGRMADYDTVTTVDKRFSWEDHCLEQVLYVKMALKSTKGIVRLGLDKDLWFHNLSYSVITSFEGAEAHFLYVS